ncbi:MAG TPA: DNA gyrase subunit A, partial [Gammaproteobacteria bacterium]|nr:DNA gyrase subunit A [Gammaproteobacteria bacterium]
NRNFDKCAGVVGEVLKNYHPHGDASVYDTLVRLAQPWVMRYPLIEGQGNFGSIDGDPPAAYRYTECRLFSIAEEMIKNIDEDTVDFVPNYKESTTEPSVLPAAVPNLLINGSTGIAVGMTTNIPPHNLTEVTNACLQMLEQPEISVDELMEHIQGPDFPTGAMINGRAGIVQAYRTGRGKIYVRAKADVETDKSGRDRIIITEIPYQLNKARLIEKIAELVKEKRVEGITELRDESDKDGLRVVIELRRGESGEVVLNNLYAQTQLQTVFGINCVALVDGQPKLLTLKEMLEAFLQHRKEVVTRRSLYLLRRARQRGHILEGQAVALANIDAVIELIKSSPSAADAREALMEKRWHAPALFELLERVGSDACRPEALSEDFGFTGDLYRLTEEQAQAILEIRLHRLTAMEQSKLMEDYQGVLDEIADLLDILGSYERLISVVREELIDVRDTYGDERRTEIIASQQDLSDEDLITEEELVVTISHQGYAKTQPLDTYQAQRRGGRGKAATSVKDEDFVEHLVITNSHNSLLCFSNQGKVYWLRVFQIPQGSRGAKGRPMINLLPLAGDERITAVLPIAEYTSDHFVFMATANGTVKKTPLEQFSRPRPSGLIALDLEEGNTLIGAAITNGSSDVMLCSSAGKAARFKESDVRAMGRTAKGVRGIRLAAQQRVISLIIPEAEGYLLTASENGFGKRTPLADFPMRGRGAQGVIAMQTSERNGQLVSAVQVFSGDELMLISNTGTLVRTDSDGVSVVGRNTQGVRLINLKEDEVLNSVERIAEQTLEQAGDEGSAATDDSQVDSDTSADADD